MYIYTLLIIGAVAIVAVGLPAFEYLIRLVLRRPLTPEQIELREKHRERVRAARDFRL
jgi:hypothetical protein